MVGVEGFDFVGRLVVDAKALERGLCSPLTRTHPRVFAVVVVPRHTQVSDALFELKAMYSRTAVSVVVMWAGEEPLESKVVDIGPDFALGPKKPLGVDQVLKDAGPMMVGLDPEQVLASMDSNLLEAELEVVLGMLGSKVAEPGLELEVEATY